MLAMQKCSSRVLSSRDTFRTHWGHTAAGTSGLHCTAGISQQGNISRANELFTVHTVLCMSWFVLSGDVRSFSESQSVKICAVCDGTLLFSYWYIRCFQQSVFAFECLNKQQNMLILHKSSLDSLCNTVYHLHHMHKHQLQVLQALIQYLA